MFVRPSPTLHKSHHESLCTGNLSLCVRPWETISVPVSFFDTFPPCTPFLVPALSWCQYYSGASIAPVAAPLWCEEMLTNISSGDLLGFASGIFKALVSAKSWCQQSLGVSKVLMSAKSPVIFLLPLHFFSRHPSSPITLLLPSPFFSRYLSLPATSSLLLLSLSYHSFSCVPEWIIKGLERSRRSALANFSGVDRSQGETVLHDL
jgi:hypothetical protein